MKLLLLGATGSTGREIVKRAIAKGHSVVAVVCASPAPSAVPQAHCSEIETDSPNLESMRRVRDDLIFSHGNIHFHHEPWRSS